MEPYSHETVVKEWIKKSTSVINKIYNRINLLNQKINYHEKQVGKIENLILKHEQRLDELKTFVSNLETDIRQIKLSNKQLNYFKFKGLLIEKTPGGFWVWWLIDSIPAIVISLVLIHAIKYYGYSETLKRIINYMGFGTH